jgi:tRNA (guanine10-N2)-methyltransferase
MPLFLLRMTLSHMTFRIPSLLSAAQIYGIPLKIISTEYARGVLVIQLEEPEHIHHLLERCIAIT